LTIRTGKWHTTRKGTDHDVNSTIAPKGKVKKSDLVIPIDHIAFDRRCFSSVTEELEKGSHIFALKVYAPAVLCYKSNYCFRASHI
jgi:hypothetical protein